MFETYSRLASQALRDEPPSEADARWILDGEDVELLPLLRQWEADVDGEAKTREPAASRP